MPRQTDFSTNDMWATPSSLATEEGVNPDSSYHASTVSVRSAIATRSTSSQGGEVACARITAMHMNHAKLNKWQRTVFSNGQDYPMCVDLSIPLARDNRTTSDLITVPGAPGAMHPGVATTEMDVILKRFEQMYNHVPDLRSLDGVTALRVIHIPKGVLKPGAQTLSDVVKASYGGRRVEQKAYLMLMLVLEAIGNAADPTAFQVAFETLQEQEYDMEPRVINIHANARARTRATREYAPRGKGKEEDDDSVENLGGEAIVHAEIPRPIIRNISVEDLMNGNLSPSNISSMVRPDRYAGFRVWIIERGGNELHKAIRAVLDRNAMRHDPDNKRMYDRDLAKKSLSECTPRQYGEKIQASNIPAIVSGYYDELGWVGRTTSAKTLDAALSPFNYFRRAGIITHAKLTYAQTSMKNYVLAPIGSRGCVSFPSGMNVFLYEGPFVGSGLLDAYLPWVQAWIVAPTIREHCENNGRDVLPMQGVSGVNPEIKFGTVQDHHIMQAGTGENAYYRVLTPAEIRERKEKQAAMQARTWVEEGGDAINDSAPTGDDSLLLLYRSILPETETNVIMGRSLQNKHPRDAASDRWDNIMKQQAQREKEGLEPLDLDKLRREEISHYFQHMGLGSSEVSPGERATYNYGVNEVPKHRWDTSSHPLFDPQFTLGDELRVQFFAAIACLMGNVDRTGLVFLIVMLGLTCYDYTDMRPHILMLGPPGASKSFFMRILGKMSLSYRNPDGTEDSIVNFIMRPTNCGLSNDTPDGATIICMDEFPDKILSATESDGMNTSWKTVLAGGSASTLEVKFNEETGERERHIGKGRPARVTMVAASNSPVDATSSNDIDEALVNRLLYVLVMMAKGDETRSVAMMIEYLKNQPEDHKKKLDYYISIYRVMQAFTMPLMDLMQAGVLPEYDTKVPIEIFTGICKESNKRRDANARPISTRKQKQFLSLLNPIALFEGIANTYLDPRSPLYGVPPNIQEHLMDVYLNTGAIGPNVAVATAGLMTPVFENPVLDIVVETINSLPVDHCYFAAESKLFEYERDAESGRSFAAVASNGKGSVAFMGPGSGPKMGGSGGVPGLDGMTADQTAKLMAGMDDFDKKQEASAERKQKLRSAITKQLTERKRALAQVDYMSTMTDAEKDKERKRVNREIADLKKKAAQLMTADEQTVTDLAARFRTGGPSSHRRFVRRGMKLHPGWRTFNFTLDEMVKRIVATARMVSGTTISSRIVMSLLSTMFVKGRSYRFLEDPGAVTTDVPVDSLSVEVTDLDNPPQIEAFSVREDPMTRRQAVWIRAEIFGGGSVSTSYLSLVKRVVHRVVRCKTWRKFQLLHEERRFPQFMEVIRVAPSGGTTTTVTAAPLDRGEKLLIFGSKPASMEDEDSLSLIQYEESSDFPPVRNFFMKQNFVRNMPTDLRNEYFKRMTPIAKKRSALKTELAIPRIAGPLNYPNDFMQSKGSEDRARLQLIKMTKAGLSLKDLEEGAFVDPGAGVTWKRIVREDGATGACFVRTDGDVLALPAPPSQPQTPITPMPGEGAMVAFSKPKEPTATSAFAARELYDIQRERMAREGRTATEVDNFKMSEYQAKALKRGRLLTKQDPNDPDEWPAEDCSSISAENLMAEILNDPDNDWTTMKREVDQTKFEDNRAFDSRYDLRAGASEEIHVVSVQHKERVHEGYTFASMDTITKLPPEEDVVQAGKLAESLGVPVMDISEIKYAADGSDGDHLPDLFGNAEDWSVRFVVENGVRPVYDPHLDITRGKILKQHKFGNILTYKGMPFIFEHPTDECAFELNPAPMFAVVDGVVYLDPVHASLLYGAEVRKSSIWGKDYEPRDPFNIEDLFAHFQRENPQLFVLTDKELESAPSSSNSQRKRRMSQDDLTTTTVGDGHVEEDDQDLDEDEAMMEALFFGRRAPKRQKPLSLAE